MDNLWILGQVDSNEAVSKITSEPVSSKDESATVVVDPNARTAPASPARSIWPQMVWLLLIFVVMYMLFLRAPRKREQQQKRMVQSLEKNDKVRTIGGILGTVVEVKGDEVVLKVDESNNTKIRVATSAIGKNLSSENK